MLPIDSNRASLNTMKLAVITEIQLFLLKKILFGLLYAFNFPNFKKIDFLKIFDLFDYLIFYLFDFFNILIVFMEGMTLEELLY